MSDSVGILKDQAHSPIQLNGAPAEQIDIEGQVPMTRYAFPRLDLKPQPSSRLVLLTQPDSAASEQYRLAQRKLANQFPDGATLLVTSPGPGDGKTLNAINLAWCLAQSQGATLLLEGDLRKPAIAKFLGCAPVRGVESAYSGELAPERVVRAINNLPLYVAMAAPRQVDYAQPPGLSGVKDFLSWARNSFRWVVVDAPPALLSADVGELATLVDGVLLVVRTRVTQRELVLKVLELLGDRLVAVLLNEATLCLDAYYRYLGAYHGAYYNKRR